MSKPDDVGDAFSSLASDLAALCAESIDKGKLSEIPNEAIGQIFASIVRVYAEKSQSGVSIRPFARNSGVTATDVAIGCIAMLDAARIELFELGAWQRFHSVNRQTQDPLPQPRTKEQLS
jgi:hypothetical protein